MAHYIEIFKWSHVRQCIYIVIELLAEDNRYGSLYRNRRLIAVSPFHFFAIYKFTISYLHFILIQFVFALSSSIEGR